MLPRARLPRANPTVTDIGAMIARDGLLVCTLVDGTPVRIPMRELLSHCAVFGKSGRGKSRLLYGLVTQLILAGETVVLLDGKGDLVDEVHSFALRLGKKPESVAVLDTHDKQWVMGVNPLERIGDQEPLSIGRSLHEALKKVYGEDDVIHPWLDLQQPSMLAALSAAGFSLAEGIHFASLTAQGTVFREAVFAAAKQHLGSDYPRRLWLDEIAALPEKEAANMTQVVRTRAGLFQMATALVPILGQCRSTLDFSRGLNSRGGLLLANLGLHANLSGEQSRMLGLCLLQQVSKVAWERQQVPAHMRSRVFLVIDEAHRYISRDFSDGLELLRGLGVHCIFSCQSLAQLEEESEAMARNILGNVNTIMSFSVARHDAEAIAHELLTGHLDLKRVKHEQVQTKFRPVESTRTIVSNSQSEGSSFSSGSMEGSGFASVEGYSASMPDGSEFGFSSPITTTSSSSHSSGSSSGYSSSSSSSSSSGQTVTEVPFIEAHEFQEVSATQFFSLQEVFELAVASIKCQGVQHVTVGWGDEPPRSGTTPTVFPRRASPSALHCYREASNRLFARPRSVVDQEIRTRVAEFLRDAVVLSTPILPALDEDGLMGPFGSQKDKRS